MSKLGMRTVGFPMKQTEVGFGLIFRSYRLFDRWYGVGIEWGSSEIALQHSM